MAQFEAQGVYHVEDLPVEAVGDSGDQRVVDRVLAHVFTKKSIFKCPLDREEELGLGGFLSFVCSSDVKSVTYDGLFLS